MDNTATNYDPLATVDDGSCAYPASTFQITVKDIDDEDNPVILGCTNPSMFNYDPNATVDDGSCISAILGCTDPTAINYDPSANVDVGNCIYPVLGCTDPYAANYNSNANTDDGSCLVSSLGFLTTNVAGGPYIALTGGGTFWAGADAIGVATIPYVPSDKQYFRFISWRYFRFWRPWHRCATRNKNCCFRTTN